MTRDVKASIAAIIFARSPDASKSTRKSFASSDRKANCCVPSSLLQAPSPSWKGEKQTQNRSLLLLHAHQRQVDEPRLRRDKALHLRAHRARVEIVDNVEPGRIVDQTLVRLAIGRRDFLRIGGGLDRLQRDVELIVLPLFEIEAVWRK